MSLHAGYSYGKKLGGIIGLSGSLFEETPISKEKGSLPDTLIVHGDSDDMVSLERAMEDYEKGGLDVREEVKIHLVKGLDHSLNKEEIGIVREFVKKRVDTS